MKAHFRADNWGPDPRGLDQCIAEEGPDAACDDVGTSAYEWVSYDPSDPTTLGRFSNSNSTLDWPFSSRELAIFITRIIAMKTNISFLL